jgi:hypothetical protein
MGVWGVVTWVAGGACAGVCVMVAAPVLAPVGAVTAIGAAIGAGVGGTAGGIVGAATSSAGSVTRAAAEKRAKTAEAKAAEYALKLDELGSRLQAEANKRKPYKAFVSLVVCFSAVGFSIAARDGKVSSKLRQTIEEFVSGVGTRALPLELKQQIAELSTKPPGFNEAMKYYALLDPSFSDKGLLELVRDLIAVVSDSRYADRVSVAAWDAAWRHRIGSGETAAASRSRPLRATS